MQTSSLRLRSFVSGSLSAIPFFKLHSCRIFDEAPSSLGLTLGLSVSLDSQSQEQPPAGFGNRDLFSLLIGSARSGSDSDDAKLSLIKERRAATAAAAAVREGRNLSSPLLSSLRRVVWSAFREI